MSAVASLYARFGVRLPELGDGWASTRCFSGTHQDRHPSARVHLRSGGFRCFTCGASGGVLDALELLGVQDRGEARRLAVEYGILESGKARRPRPTLPDVRPVPAASVERPRTAVAWGEPVDYDALAAGSEVALERRWVYVDEGGAPVGCVHRLDLDDGGKRIWQERPEGDCWTPGLAGAHLPLYRLPDVLEHARRGERVIVVEGEKAVDALDRLGFFATTCAQGAGKWRDEHTAALAGATVLTITDCDLAGRLHAIGVSLSCLAAGVHVLDPLDPEPDRSDGFDIVDHLAAVADTLRAVSPRLDSANLRARLHDHLERLLARQLPANSDGLQRQVEHVHYSAEPSGRALLDCQRCGEPRVHRLSHGLAFCPCGAHQAAP